MLGRLRGLLFLALAPACGTAEEPSTTTTTTFTPTTDAVPQPTLATTTGVLPTTTEAATTEDPEPTQDHPGTSPVLPDFGGDGPDCNGKIDILFINDRWHTYWPTMKAALEVVRPKFVEWFANFDTHWMSATVHKTWGMLECPEVCAANDGVTCHPAGPHLYPCAAHTDGSLTPCDTTRGAGLTFLAGFESPNKRCELAGGQRYIQSTQEPDLLSALECITTFGYTDITGIYAEEAMVNAIKPTMTKVPDGCNYKFLRDDALLLIVLMSHNLGSGGSFAGLPEDWANVIYASKGGDEDKVLVLGIVTDRTLPEPTICEKVGSVDYSSDVEHFLHFEIKHAIHGSQCADDYVPFFEEAMERALELCGAEPPT